MRVKIKYKNIWVNLPICLLFFNFFIYLSIFFSLSNYPNPVSTNLICNLKPYNNSKFFSFFDELPSAPNTTGMTLMLLMFHILLISLFSSWYLSIFSFFFSLTLMPTGIAISIMAQFLSFLFTTTISGVLLLLLLLLLKSFIQNKMLQLVCNYY